MIGCAVTLGFGLLLSMGSVFRIMQLIRGRPIPFVVFYSLGNVVSLCGSMFLSGPWNQIKRMFAPTRAFATIVYLSTLVTTLTLAFTPGVPFKGGILLILFIVQLLALFWYMLSYIPGARNYATKCLKASCCEGDWE
uniref:Vesicle transport protein n=1 Tax=Fibrocapsa japonica TaxID=94617 RepID=A0A7S2XZK4_9STRA